MVYTSFSYSYSVLFTFSPIFVPVMLQIYFWMIKYDVQLMISPNKIHLPYNLINSQMQQIPDMKKSQILLNQIQNNEYLLEIEGQCKIKSLEALQFRYLKVILVIIFSLLTIIPLIILLNFKKFRKICFYSSCDFPEADHLYVIMQDQTFDIVKI